MTLVERTSTEGARTGGFVLGACRAGAKRPCTRRAAAGALVAVVLSIPLSVLARPATADQTGDLQAQANQLAAQIADGGSRIHQLNEQFDQATQQVNALRLQVGAAEADLADTQRRVDASRALLQRQAVDAYVTQGTNSSTLSILIGSDPNELGIRQEYITATTGNVQDTIDSLRLAEESLRNKEASLRTAQQAAESAAERVQQTQDAAASQVQSEQSVLSQVKGEMATLVAQAEQARLAAEAAANRQAQARAVTVAAQGQPTTSGLSSFGGSSGAGFAAGGGGGGDPFAALRQCESGGDYGADTGNGYYGAYQFSADTWHSLGYPGLPNQAPAAVQDQAARQLQAASGWGAWPTCAAILGLG